MRELIGATGPELFDNPTGEPIWDDLPAKVWRSYLDFGCGCGRSARRLIQQTPRPERYVGVDLHAGMIQWCTENLAPAAPGFEFVHHNVYSPCLNPDRTRPWAEALPVADGSVSLMEATSVFTHLIESQIEYYLDEVARVLTPDGLLLATFFLFDKDDFPFMQDTQNALYINDRDPTNAVVVDRDWLRRSLTDRGLLVTDILTPVSRGFHWRLTIAMATSGRTELPIPVDEAPPGRHPPPLVRAGAERIGLDPAAAGERVVPSRVPLPPPDPVAAELAGAKEYIASLENEVDRLREAAGASPQPPAPPPRKGLHRRVRRGR